MASLPYPLALQRILRNLFSEPCNLAARAEVVTGLLLCLRLIWSMWHARYEVLPKTAEDATWPEACNACLQSRVRRLTGECLPTQNVRGAFPSYLCLKASGRPNDDDAVGARRRCKSLWFHVLSPEVTSMIYTCYRSIASAFGALKLDLKFFVLGQ